MTIDLASLQEKYSAEAQKRLKPNGSDQFEEVQQSGSDRIRRLARDLWADHAALDKQLETCSPLEPGDRIKFLISGAGIAGISSAVRLILAGFDPSQIRLVDSAGGVGGAWYWNRFPGLFCDVESYVYLPLLEEMGYVPTQKYVSGVEIRRYLNQVVQKYGLDDKILFRTKLETLDWDEQSHRWRAGLATSRGATDAPGEPCSSFSVEAEFAILTAGYLSRPQLPKLEGAGLDVFEGEMLHTARWDYGITGGSGEEPFPQLDRLKGKRVGILGTGATAVQVLPCLAEHADEVVVFQRTPAAVYRRGQRATDAAAWASQIADTPGWQKRRMQSLTAYMSGVPGAVDLVDDEWSRQRAFAALTGGPDWAHATPDQVPALVAHYTALDAGNRARLRERVAATVRDAAVAARLTPWYPVWCKRPAFSDTYLAAFNRPNVRLVDTAGRGVDGATARGLRAAGAEHALDVLVLATGYVAPAAAGLDTAARAGVRVVGRAGRSLAAHWAAQGVATLHGVAASGFPNLFWFGALQAGAAANIAHMIDAQSRHMAHIIATAHRAVAHGGGDGGDGGGGGGSGANGERPAGRCVVEVEAQAEEAWSLRILQGATRWAAIAACTPSYLNMEGAALRMAQGLEPAPTQQDMIRQARATMFSAGGAAYVEQLEEWQSQGGLCGYRVSQA